jgi:hypothetical protein
VATVITIGQHVPAVLIVLEHEARPKLISTNGDQSIDEITDWLGRAHPDWLEVLARACDLTLAADWEN